MKEIVNEYKEYLLNSHKSENTVYAYVTDVNLYIKYLNTKDIYLDETDNLTVLGIYNIYYKKESLNGQLAG